MTESAHISAPTRFLLSGAARKFSTRLALDGHGGSLTYSELNERVGGAARSLSNYGVEESDAVALLGHNSIDLIVGILAVMRVGGIAVPISTRLPAARVAEAVRTTGARLILTEDRTAGVASSLDPDVSELPLTSLRAERRSGGDGSDPDRPCLAVFTSGSSGPAKAAVLTSANLWYSAVGSSRNLNVSEEDRWALTLPLYHVGGIGILFRCMLAGAAVVLPDPAGGLSGDFLDAEHVTHVSVVPTQMRRLLGESARLDRLRAILAGGGPIPADLRSAFRAAEAPLYVSYGMTEMASQISTTGPFEGAPDTPDAGRVLPFRSVRIDTSGEILVRGETLFAGYLEGGRLRRPLDAEGWFHTGDIGRFTPDACLLVAGRADNMFVSGGENVHPEEIERALLSLPGVDRAVVVDVPDVEFGARPVAFVEFSGRRSTAGEISERLRHRLPRFKHPVEILRFPAVDEGALGKPDRSALRRFAARARGSSG